MDDPTVADLLDATFVGDSLATARDLMERFEGGPWAHAQGATRIPFAVLKIADGDTRVLADAIESAETDWRDTLMGAGFGHDVEAHLSWARAVPQNSARGPG